MINGPSWGLVEQAVGKGQESRSFISYHLENRMLMDGIERITTINLSNDKRTIGLKQRTDSVGNDFTATR
jgi:hypothetical protein